MTAVKKIQSKTGVNMTKMRKIDKLQCYTKSSLRRSSMKNVDGLNWWIPFTVLTVCALITRLSYLGCLNIVTWDEVHFGKFSNNYISGTFYNDVHPPLGKIFIAAAAYITGYGGNFNFTYGSEYDNTIPYQLIRSEMAVLGALLVPMSFLTVYELTKSVEASTLGAIGVLCDTFLHKINSLIILDPLLNIAIAFCVLATLKFGNQRNSEWSVRWWSWLTAMGFGLGVVMSIKYIGVFTVLFVGLHTAYQLLTIISDKNQSLWKFFAHFLARIVCLILLPIAVYLSTFVLHFSILTETQPNQGGWMDTRLYASLNNTEYTNIVFPKYVNYGANLTIMSSSPPAGYLDSWFDLFPKELTAPCQVTSTIDNRDPDGTLWRVRRVNLAKSSVDEGIDLTEPPILVRNGDLIMLTHVGSDRSLRSHSYRAPYTKGLYQVCTYGDDGSGGPFETWRVIIPGEKEREPLRVFEHDFMLQNFKMDCYLKSTDVNLPRTWAHEGSREVGCARSSSQADLKWHINWIDTAKAAGETTLKKHQFGLWEKIKSLHEIMFKFNSLIKVHDVDSIESSIGTSSPWMWPIVYRMQMLGIPFSAPESKSGQFAIASFNPVVAYMNLFSLFLQGILGFVHLFKMLRFSNESTHVIDRRKRTLWACMWLTTCWGMHYLPFFFMGRTLYVHHYCPAYMYSCLITGFPHDWTEIESNLGVLTPSGVLGFLLGVAEKSRWKINKLLCSVTFSYLSEIVSESIGLRWMKSQHRTGILVSIPSLAFVVSYLMLYPMATCVDGKAFEFVPRISSFLDWLNLGQPWVEFGFQTDTVMTIRLATQMMPIEDENFDNPWINATLHYITTLNLTKSFPGEVSISPTTVQLSQIK